MKIKKPRAPKAKERYYYNAQAVQRVVDFFKTYITHVEGPLSGKPYILDKWIIDDIIKPIFGSYDRKTNKRAVREAYIEIPKKNSKSTLSAGLGLYFLVADRENTPRIYCAASSRDQANIVFEVSKGMVYNNPELTKRVKPMHNSIVKKEGLGGFKIISADAGRHHGYNASCIIIDELHAHPSRELYDTLKTSGFAREQPLVITITTAGYDLQSICYNRHLYAKKVISGTVIDPSFHGVIYAADPEDDPFSPKTHKKANPNYGKSVKKETIEALANQAKNDPSYLNTFKRLHLNIWTQSHTQWIEETTYNKCDLGGAPEDLKGHRCWVGLDLGATDDITAMVLLFKEKESNIFSVVPYFFCTENKLSAVQNNSTYTNYMQWAQNGYIEPTPGDVTDYDYVLNRFRQITQDYKVRSVGYDGWNATQLAVQMTNEFRGLPINPIGMNVKNINAPAKELERIIKGEEKDKEGNIIDGKKLFNHFGNPVLQWMFNNCMVKRDANDNIYLNKAKATGKIDGVVALCLAMSEYMNDQYKDFTTKTDFTFL